MGPHQQGGEYCVCQRYWSFDLAPWILGREMLQARAKVAVISKDGVRHRSTSQAASLLRAQVTKCVPK